MNVTHHRIRLTPFEMHLLDDGQDWYKPSDECWLGGYLGEEDAAALDLCVNGTTHDAWTRLHELPDAIRERLINSFE
jgi:hypothetical protein